MYKLANISQFESLIDNTSYVVNNRMVVDNGFGGQILGSYLFAKPGIIKRGNKKNYQAAMNKANQLCASINLDPKVEQGIRKGFKLFAGFCSNIKEDISSIIKYIPIAQHTANDANCWVAFTENGTIHIPMTPAGIQKHEKYYPGMIAHELIHALEHNLDYLRKAETPKRAWLGYTLNPKLKRIKPDIKLSLALQDRLRSWIAGVPYAGVVSGMRTIAEGKEGIKDDSSLSERERNRYYMKNLSDKDKRLLKKHKERLLNYFATHEKMGTEYLTRLVDLYAVGEVRLLHVLDAMRILHNANKMARKPNE